MLGPIFADIAGPELTSEEEQLLQDPLIGGVVLFTRNYQSPTQLTALCAKLHALRSPALLVTVDHEGGRVQRFEEGFTRLPALATLGEQYQHDSAAALLAAKQWGFIMASELKVCGVDLSFAPVLDLNKGISKVLAGGRAIAEDAATTIAVARAYIQGMHDAGMTAIGKHFPGHGSVVVDSHIGLPTDARTLATILANDAQPFVELFDELQGIMPAHIIFPEVDDKPASLSHVWLHDILRQQLGFQGVVVSDCLSMAGAAKIAPNPVERVELALAAGCDIVLMCNDPVAVKTVLSQLVYVANATLSKKITSLRSFHEVV